MVIRIVLFGGLAYYSAKAVVLYAVSYLIFVKTLSFVDAFQHTYDVYVGSPSDKALLQARRDKEYEDQNTYSNWVSTRFPSLNLLTLNFVYHNAHHAHPSVPWYQLPAWHHSQYGNDPRSILPMRHLLKTYHLNRVKRVLVENYGTVNQKADYPDKATHFVGALGVSFLTVV